jgi:glucokinase
MLVGIDIGGTKINVCLGDLKANIIDTVRLKTEPAKGKENATQNIFAAIESLLKKHQIKKIEAIGLSVPGPVDSKAKKLLTPPNLKGWENYEIGALFEKKYARPIFFNNDANCQVLAEYHLGNQKRCSDLIYLTMSTGMGGGIIINHKLVQGYHDIGGEVGHYILEPNGPACPCGQRGCFEAFCGGKNFAQAVQMHLQQHPTKTKILDFAKTIDAITTKEILNAVIEKDPFALEIFDPFLERLAQGIGILMMTLNPKAIILGTMAIHAKEHLLDPLKEKLKKYAWPQARECILEASVLGFKISQLSSLAVALDGLSK